MKTPLITNPCPKCGADIPADAPQGLCPRCVLARAATPTEAGRQPGERIVAPPREAVVAAFPQLEILELIGVGGMGVVYKARQPQLDRFVALKLLPQSLGADPAFAERFQREARFLARLHHPNIVSVFDFGQAGGFCYLLLEFVDGVNLRQAMQAGRFSPAEALAIVPHICGALQYAHEQGVLHRDIKPENILLDARGQVKLADFGIAKLVSEPGAKQAEITLTQDGARLGTPHYMAPEQVENPGSVDHRADIYSLGVVFYELLTGELPLGRFAPPSAKADLDARVDAIVFRALAKERELRQQSAGEVRTEVEGLGSPVGREATGASRNRPVPAVAPNPWPHRLFWLVLALIILPVAALMAAILAPLLMRGVLHSGGGFLAGLVPMAAGAGLVFGYWLTRPKASEAQPRAAWNPWPQRVFWAVLGLIVAPACLVAVGLLVPMVSRQQAPAGPAVAPPMVDDSAAVGTPGQKPGPKKAMKSTPEAVGSNPNGEVGGLPEILPAGTPGPAAMKWHLAWQHLGELRKQAEVGVVSPHGIEMLAAERDLAVAAADFKDDAVGAASAKVTYAKAVLDQNLRMAAAGTVSSADVTAAQTALMDAELFLRFQQRLAAERGEILPPQ